MGFPKGRRNNNEKILTVQIENLKKLILKLMNIKF